MAALPRFLLRREYGGESGLLNWSNTMTSRLSPDDVTMVSV